MPGYDSWKTRSPDDDLASPGDGLAASNKRNPDYPPSDWDKCDHEWKFLLHSEYEDDVRCVKCSAPGRRERDGSVYWPTT